MKHSLYHLPPWLPSALALPVALLTWLSIWLVQSERRQVTEDLRTEAQQAVSAFATSEQAPRLPEAVLAIPAWQQQRKVPPVNDLLLAKWEATHALTGEPKHQALEALWDEPSLAAAFTSAGVSLQMLVAHALWRNPLDLAGPADRSKWASATLRAGWEHPNVLSSKLILEVAPETAAVRLRCLDTSLALSAASPLPAGAIKNTSLDGTQELLWTSLIHPVFTAAQERWSKILQPGQAFQVYWNGNPLPPETKGTSLAESTDGNFTFAAVNTATETISTRTSKRLQWLFYGLSVAVLTTTAAMLAVWLALRRQARLSRLQSEFVASVSHELRTPVASMGVLAERLEQGDLSPEQTDQYRQWMTREGRRLGNLVENILDFSRIEREQKQYDFEPVELPMLVQETVGILQPYAAEKQISLTSEISWPADAPPPEMDANAIRQALINLIENALKFTAAGGRVVVKCGTDVPSVSREHAARPVGADGRDAQATVLSVTDTGIGIPETEHQRIFQRFYRVPAAVGQETTGAGIGLSIVQHTVLAHGGTISVRSHPGQGTTMTLTFPPPPKIRS